MGRHPVIQTLLQGRLFIYLTVVVAVAISLWLNKVLPKMYDGQVSFYVPIGQDSLSLLSEGGTSARAFAAPVVWREQLRAYFAILRSQRVAERVSELVKGRTVEQIRAETRFRLTNAGLFVVTTTDKDPLMAARIANAYADSFNELFEEISLPRAVKMRKFIEEELEKLKVELTAEEQKLKEFKMKQDAASLSEKTSLLVKQVTELRAQAELAAVSLDEVEARIGTAEKQLRSEAAMQLSQEVVATNPLVQQLESKLSDLEVQLAGLRAKFTPLHPDVLKAQQELLEAKKQLQVEIRRIVASETRTLNPVHENLRQGLVGLYADERALKAKVAGLRGIIGRLEGELAEIPDLQRLMADLTRRVLHLEEIDRLLVLKREDARIQEKREIQTFLIVDRARPAGNPAYPNLLLSVPAAGVLGGVAGMCYAMFLAFLKVSPPAEHPASSQPAAGGVSGRP